MSGAVLEITDGTAENTVSLLGGPFYLMSWSPVIADYKDGGVFVDSPLSDGRIIRYKRFQNATERFDFVQSSPDVILAGEQIQTLIALIERASDYWIMDSTTRLPIYIRAKASKETKYRYAEVVKGRLPNTGNPFAQPFMQDGCRVVQQDLSLLIERKHWTDTPPKTGAGVNIRQANMQHNLVSLGNFEAQIGSDFYWTEYNSPTVNYTTDKAYSGAYSAKVTGSSGSTKGIYQDVGSTLLESGVTYTLTCWVYPVSGNAKVCAYDGGAWTNAVCGDSDLIGISDQWVQVSVTKTATANGIRVFLGTSSTTGGVAYFDRAEIVREHGINDQLLAEVPILISNYRGLGNLTHIFRNDVGVGYSGNLLNDTLPYALWPSSPVATDELYFGSAIKDHISPPTERVGIPFPNVAFNINKGGATNNGELISNRSFESSTTGWESISNTPSPAYFSSLRTTSYGAYDGSYAMLLRIHTFSQPLGGFIGSELESDDLEQGGKFITTSYYTITGDEVNFGVWAKHDGGNDWINLKFYLAVDWFDASNNFISRNLARGVVTESTSTWTRNEVNATKPATATKCKVAVYVTNTKGYDYGVVIDYASLIETTANYNITWKYYDGATWADLSIRDETDGFKTASLNVASWAIPPDWELYSVNGVKGFWVKAVISTLSGTFVNPTVDKHPYSVVSPYIEVDSQQFYGDLSSLGEMLITNEGGPFEGSTILSVAAGSDDVHVDNAGTPTLTTTGVTARIEQDTALGIRFESVDIPVGAKIIEARLFTHPSSEPASWVADNALTYISFEDYDSPAYWSSATDFNNRTLGTEMDWYMNYYSHKAAKLGSLRSPDLAYGLQEIIDRAGWAEGNDIHVRIRENIIVITDYREFYMYETDTKSWRLEVQYIEGDNYTSSMIIGAREVNRGEDFNAYIHLAQRDQPGIEVEGGISTNWTEGPAPNYAVCWTSPIRYITNPFYDGNFHTFASIRIRAPLSQQYVGTFRAFIRASHGGALSSTEKTTFRMSISTGSGGSDYTGESSFTARQVVEAVDLGQIDIRDVGEADDIIFRIESARTHTEAVFAFDLILIPVDEWAGEFTNRGTSLRGVLDAGSVLKITSIGQKRGPVEATLLTESATQARARFTSSGPELNFPRNVGNIRYWFLAITNTELTPGGTDVANASLPNLVHAVNFNAQRRFLSMRGEL